MKTKAKILVILLILQGFISYFPTANGGGEWIIEGDLIYVDDSKSYISANPHTIGSSGWVTFTIVSKQFSGEIDAVWGVDSDTMKPTRAEVWRNYTHSITEYSPVNDTMTYSITEITGHQPITVDEFLAAPYRIGNEFNTEFYEVNGSIEGHFDTHYVGVVSKSGNLSNLTVTTIETVIAPYTYESSFYDWAPTSLSPDRILYEFDGMDTWYLIRKFNVAAGVEYKIRLYMDVPFSGLKPVSGKYSLGFKLSSDTIHEAIQNNRFYYLDPWFDVSWGYSSKITVDHDKVDTDLTHFPVMVYLNSSRIDWDHVQDDLDDLRFTMDNVTLLPHEIDTSYVDVNATLWVALDLNSSADTVFYVYYGNSGATSAENITGVWDDDFLAVYHCDDLTTSTIDDSTANNKDASKTGANQPYEVNTPLGKGQNMTDGLGWKITSDSAIGPQIDGMAIEAYHNWNLVGHTHRVFDKSDWWFMLQVYGTPPNYKYRGRIYLEAPSTNNENNAGQGPVPVVKTWYYAAWTYSNTLDLLKIYIDDTLIDSKATLPSPGTIQYGTANFETEGQAIYDEIRISNTSRSDDWFEVTYDSIIDNLLSYGSEVSLPDYTFDLQVINSTGDGIPDVLVVISEGPSPNATFTDASGNIDEQTLVMGTYTLTLSKDGYLTYEHQFSISSDLNLLVRLYTLEESTTILNSFDIPMLVLFIFSSGLTVLYWFKEEDPALGFISALGWISMTGYWFITETSPLILAWVWFVMFFLQITLTIANIFGWAYRLPR